MARSSRLALAALATLALGIGATTAVFSLVNAVLLKGVSGLDDTKGLVVISRDIEGRHFDMSYPVLAHLRDESRSMDSVVGLAARPVALGGGGEPAVHMSVAVTADYFGALRVRPALNTVSNGYFDTLRLQLLQGRDFTAADSGERDRMAVVNRSMAARFWPAADAVGQEFWLGPVGQGLSFEVIGVVEDAKYNSLSEATPNFYYVPWKQRYNAEMTLHVRTAVGATSPAPLLRQVVRDMDASLPVPPAQPLGAALEVFFLPQRMAAWVAGTLGLAGLLLGAVGVYGVTAFAVAQRTREIGVRLALGARPADVLLLVLRQGARAPLIGMLVGLAVAAALTRFLGSILVGVSPLDTLTYGIVIATLAGIATLAMWLPARRAAKLDPATTLRTE